MEYDKLRSVSHIITNKLIINDAIWSDIVTTACTCKSKADLGRREEKFLDPRMIAYIKRHLVHCPLAIITVFSVMCLVLAIIPVFMCSIKFHLILCKLMDTKNLCEDEEQIKRARLDMVMTILDFMNLL